MPQVETEQELIPAGEHILTLRSVDEKEMSKFGSKNENDTTTRWIWKFTSQMRDDDDKPYTLVIYTNTRYGNSNASLTHLLDLLIPNCTKEIARSLNTDDILGNKYKARIKHVTGDTGKMRAEIITAAPYSGKKRPDPDDDEPTPTSKKAPVKKDDYDPFEED
jgi:hypothetical protein